VRKLRRDEGRRSSLSTVMRGTRGGRRA
jgi:hypothetical protein